MVRRKPKNAEEDEVVLEWMRSGKKQGNRKTSGRRHEVLRKEWCKNIKNDKGERRRG